MSKNITRKDFIKNTALAMAGITISTNVLQASDQTSSNLSSSYKLKNVRLETGFEYENDEIVGTKTDLFLIEIKHDQIISISKNDQFAKAIDAKGLLMLPSFKDMHIHLDKTFYGDKWQAVRKHGSGVKGMIELEQKIMPELLKTSTHKAEKLIELLQSKGTTYARSHVNIEPTSQLNSLKNLEKALENKKNSFGAELVAFPQHGVYYTNTAPILKEAAQMDIDYIGGVDPFSIDGAIEKTMDYTIQLALDYNKGIDIHLHESGESGVKTIEYLINKVIENPVLKNKTYVSHAFALGKLPKNEQEKMAEKLAEAKIGIVSTIPFGGLIMPIPTLYKYNVEVLTGNDSIIDHWNTFGTGSVLQKANLMAQLYGYNNEFLLSRSLKLATANLLPLDDKGNQQWPKVNDKAHFILIDASCSAEAVARVSPVKATIYSGNLTWKNQS